MKTNLAPQNAYDSQITIVRQPKNEQICTNQLLEIKKIIKTTLMNSILISQQQKLTLTTKIKKIEISEPFIIEQINKFISYLPINIPNLEKQNFCVDVKIMQYFLKISITEFKNNSQSNLWKYQSLLWQSQALLDKLKSLRTTEVSQKQEKIIQLLHFNNLISYIHLQTFNKALIVIKSLEEKSQNQNYSANRNLQILKKIVLMKMGLPLSNDSSKKDTKTLKICKINQIIKAKENRSQQCFKILSLTKKQLINFLQHLSLNQEQICIQNAYNLALMCKKYKLFQWSLTLLNYLTKQSQIKANELLYAKCLILTCQIHQEMQDFPSALASLKNIKLSNFMYTQQINLYYLRLNKKITLINSTTTCPNFTTSQSKKYMLLQNLQNQLNKILKQPKTNQLHKRNITNCLYNVKSKRKLNLKKHTINHQNKHKQQNPPLSLLISKRTSQQHFTRLSSPKNQQFQQVQEHTELKKNLVTFKKNESQTHPINTLLYNHEQKINELIMQNHHQSAQKEIEHALGEIKNIENKQSLAQIHKFKLKCIYWLRDFGNNEKTIPLLKNIIKTIKDDSQNRHLKMIYLQELSKSYEQLNDLKNAIAINIQLTNLGEIESYNKIGQLYMIKQDYNEAFKYYQKYNELKGSIQSKIKFAHICSKMSRFCKISVDLLNQIIYQNKNNHTLRQFQPQMHEEIQNAVLLLISIYLSKNMADKAQHLCIEYLKVNYGAFPIYYMLGIVKSREGQEQVAFNHFLTALKLKPNYVPALVQILNYIGVNQITNIHIISILRKAFICNHRNWEILQLFIEALTRVKNDKFKTSVKELLDCAQIFQEAKGIKGGLMFEAEIVLLWALQKIEEYKKKGLLVDNQHQNKIYLKLGDLNLEKGNYLVSQDYYLKLMHLIKINKSKITSKSTIQKTAKIELQILKKLVFIKLQQKAMPQALQLLNNCHTIIKRYNLTEEMPQILNKINFLSHQQIRLTT